MKTRRNFFVLLSWLFILYLKKREGSGYPTGLFTILEPLKYGNRPFFYTSSTMPCLATDFES